MADVSKKVQVILTAENKTGPAIDDASKGFGSLQNAASGAAKVIGAVFTVAIAAATKFAKDSFDAFVESEKQMTQATFMLKTTLGNMTEQELTNLKKTTGNASDSLAFLKTTMENVGNQATKLGMDDEEASKAFAKLYSITKDVSKAQEEVALAMDLAAFSGRTVEAATEALTLVHAGGTKVLKEFGFEVGANITAEEALALVHGKVSGAATEMAQTSSGQMAVLQQSWSNLKEEVGKSLSEAIQPFVATLTEWVQSDETKKLLLDLAKNMKELAKELGPVVKELLPLLVKLLSGAVAIGAEFTKGVVEMGKGIGEVVFQIMRVCEWFQKMIDKISAAIRKLNEWTGASSTTSIGSGVVSAVSGSNPVLGGIMSAVGAMLPKFATGGVVGGALGMPQLAVVHGGETVVPAGGGAGGIVVNVGGNMFLDDNAAEYFGDKLVNILKNQIRIGE